MPRNDVDIREVERRMREIWVETPPIDYDAEFSRTPRELNAAAVAFFDLHARSKEETYACGACGYGYPRSMFKTRENSRPQPYYAPGLRYERNHDFRVCVYCFVSCTTCDADSVQVRNSTNVWNRVVETWQVDDLCVNCSRRCGVCTRPFPREHDMVEDRDYGWVCREHVQPCVDCGAAVPLRRARENMMRLVREQNAEDAAAQANRCADCMVRITGQILNYSYKPEPKFMHPEGVEQQFPKLFIGIEHEFNVPRQKKVNESIKWVYDHDPDRIFYCKSDGSMDHGFEMVSHPMSLEYFRTRYPIGNLQAMVDLKLAETGENTGIHIHVSRDSFTPYHMYRMLHLHYNFPKLVIHVAGRRSDRMANLYVEGMNKLEKQVEVVKDQVANGGRNGYHNRYVAVNLNNRSTIEYRVFQSTMDPTQLTRYVEWIEAMYHFTRLGRVRGVTHKQITDTRFKAWVEENADRFPNLSANLATYEPTGPVKEQTVTTPAKFGVKWKRLQEKRTKQAERQAEYANPFR